MTMKVLDAHDWTKTVGSYETAGSYDMYHCDTKLNSNWLISSLAGWIFDMNWLMDP